MLKDKTDDFDAIDMAQQARIAQLEKQLQEKTQEVEKVKKELQEKEAELQKKIDLWIQKRAQYKGKIAMLEQKTLGIDSSVDLMPVQGKFIPVRDNNLVGINDLLASTMETARKKVNDVLASMLHEIRAKEQTLASMLLTIQDKDEKLRQQNTTIEIAHNNLILSVQKAEQFEHQVAEIASYFGVAGREFLQKHKNDAELQDNGVLQEEWVTSRSV